MAVVPTKSERENLWRLVEMAKHEDLGSGDVTSAILPPELGAHAQFVAREPMVVCGCVLLAQEDQGHEGIRRDER